MASAYPVVSANRNAFLSALSGRLAQVGRTPYLLILSRFVPSSKSEQRLERRHRRLPPIVTKYEFIEINLELITANTVMSSEQPLLEIANGPVCQRHHGFRAFSQVDSQRLAARYMLEACLFQPSEAFQSVSVYGGTWRHVVLKEGQQSLASEIRDHSHACAPGGVTPPLLSL
jgi:hypothetical protein